MALQQLFQVGRFGRVDHGGIGWGEMRWCAALPHGAAIDRGLNALRQVRGQHHLVRMHDCHRAAHAVVDGHAAGRAWDKAAQGKAEWLGDLRRYSAGRGGRSDRGDDSS